MSQFNTKTLRIYEAIAYESAVDAADRDDTLTPDELAEARRLVAATRARVLAKQRDDRATRQHHRVRPSIVAMVRAELEARLRWLFEAHPDAVFAHRDLTSMSDDDLRTALEDAEALVDRLS